MTLLITCVFLLFSAPILALDVVLLSPEGDNSVFWQRVQKITKGAAEDLAINLTVINFDNHHTIQINNINKIIADKKSQTLLFLCLIKKALVIVLMP